MSELSAQLALKARLDRTWAAFLARHGNFTDTQFAAIPPLLDGSNVMLCAPTASGKTEAALMPLIERYLPPDANYPSPVILYLTPTKALVNDLQTRLSQPLAALRLDLGVKTRDVNTLGRNKPPAVLITTPESCDSLLAKEPKTFINTRAVVLDELHLFDSTPRGDQLRVVLNRIRRIRSYAAQHGDAADSHIQYAALSASLAQPQLVAARYFPDARIIQVGATRPIHADDIALSPDHPLELLAYLQTFRDHGWRKALAFCNSRAEVEAYAAAVRENSPFGDAVFVHYSNLEAKRRHDIEQRFAAESAAICFASSTLELGIDIGSIDVILLIGAPGSTASFIQRAGRGNRRQAHVNLACFHRTPLEQLTFEALCVDPSTADSSPSDFRPAVAVQQIFSLLKQSRSGAVRLAELAALFEDMLTVDAVQIIVGQLETLHYLEPARPGEWRAGERLNRLVDQQANPHQSLSLYSNIRGSEGRQVEIRDQYTQKTVARVDAQWLDRSVLTLEGRVVNVEWYDGEAMLIRAATDDSPITDKLRYLSSRQILSFDLAQKLATHIGLPTPVGNAPLVKSEVGWLWFHWLGDLYGGVLRDLMGEYTAARLTNQSGLCFLLDTEPAHSPPAWTEKQITRYLEDNYRRIESLLDLGPYHHLLPAALRRRTVVEQFNVPRFLSALGHLNLFTASDTLADRLQALLRE